MQNIPRNELLDKLAAGWKCRRKTWAKSAFKQKDAGLKQDVYILDLLCDDWEGEPPKPVRVYDRCTIAFAFDELIHHKAQFIRRSAWKTEWKCIFNPSHPIELQKDELSFEDILATDWEVWG